MTSVIAKSAGTYPMRSCGSICGNPKRDRALVCVVEDVRDVMAIENYGQFTGIYHVLGGIISPMEGIGPGDLNIQGLVDKVITGSVSEVILAFQLQLKVIRQFLYL